MRQSDEYTPSFSSSLNFPEHPRCDSPDEHVASRDVPLRAEENRQSAVIAWIPHGDTFDVVQTKGSNAYVLYRGHLGWVSLQSDGGLRTIKMRGDGAIESLAAKFVTEDTHNHRDSRGDSRGQISVEEFGFPDVTSQSAPAPTYGSLGPSATPVPKGCAAGNPALGTAGRNAGSTPTANPCVQSPSEWMHRPQWVPAPAPGWTHGASAPEFVHGAFPGWVPVGSHGPSAPEFVHGAFPAGVPGPSHGPSAPAFVHGAFPEPRIGQTPGACGSGWTHAAHGIGRTADVPGPGRSASSSGQRQLAASNPGMGLPSQRPPRRDLLFETENMDRHLALRSLDAALRKGMACGLFRTALARVALGSIFRRLKEGHTYREKPYGPKPSRSREQVERKIYKTYLNALMSETELQRQRKAEVNIHRIFGQ